MNAKRPLHKAIRGAVRADGSEIRRLVEDVNRAFAEFRTSNDERIKQIEARGAADPLLVTKVDNANAAITDITARLDKIAAEAARVNAGTSARAREFSARQREHIAAAFGVDSSDINADHLKQLDEYERGVRSYLRKGKAFQAAMTVDSDPDGGYLVAPSLAGRMIDLIYETSPIRSFANVVTIGTDAIEGTLDLDEAAFGGWVSERGTRGETGTPQIGKWRIEVHEMFSEPHATQQLLDDSAVNVEAWLAGKVAERFSRVQNDAFVNGDGVGKPRGFLTYSLRAGDTTKANFGKSLQGIVTGTSGGFGTTPNGTDKLIDLVYLLKARYRSGAAWMMNRKTLAEVRKLKDGDGNYIWQPDFTQRQGGTLLGYSIGEAEDMPDIAANTLAIAFGDFNAGYQIVDRAGIRVLRDPFTRKPYVKFYTTARVGGDVMDFDALKFLKFGTTI